MRHAVSSTGDTSCPSGTGEREGNPGTHPAYNRGEPLSRLPLEGFGLWTGRSPRSDPAPRSRSPLSWPSSWVPYREKRRRRPPSPPGARLAPETSSTGSPWVWPTDQPEPGSSPTFRWAPPTVRPRRPPIPTATPTSRPSARSVIPTDTAAMTYAGIRGIPGTAIDRPVTPSGGPTTPGLPSSSRRPGPTMRPGTGPDSTSPSTSGGPPGADGTTRGGAPRTIRTTTGRPTGTG